MCASFIDRKKIQIAAIGCCLTIVVAVSPTAAQLFQRRGNTRQTQRQNDEKTPRADANATGQPAARVPSNGANAASVTGAELYEVPSTSDVDELVKHLSTLLTYQPKTKEDAETYRQRAPQAMTLAAQRILQLEPNQSSDNYLFAQKYLLAVDVMSIDQATNEEKQELMEIIVKNLQRAEMDADDLDIAIAFTEGLEMSGDRQMASTAYSRFAQVFGSNKDPMILELGQLMEGSARRLNLVGNTMTVEGTTLDGQSLNWSDYRGKVVLIDFWATWCGPCIKEIPALKQQYEAYHDRGFEVIGICMNEKREQVDMFFEKNEVPWVTLFEPEGKTNQTATYYGISSLPTTILIDQQGRVVTLAARGEALTQQLARLLGPAG